MNAFIHRTLLATAIGMVLSGSAVAQTADAMPVSDTAATAIAIDPAELLQMRADMAALRAELELLKQQVAQSNSSAAPAPVASTTAAPAPAPANALAASAAAPSLPVISGKMYADFTHIDQRRSALGQTDATGTGFDVKRFYLGVAHEFDRTWSVNLTTDFNYVSGIKQTSLFVKKAYLQANLDSNNTLRLGSADLPWIAFVEGAYGYRYVEPTLVDRLKFGASTDWGVHLFGKAPNLLNSSYALSLANGNGFKNPSRSQSMDVEARVGISPIAGLTLAVGGYSGRLGQNVESTDAIHTARRGDAMIAWAGKRVAVGGEYFVATDWNNVLSPLGDKSTGYSLWTNVGLSERVKAFARYDSAELSKRQDRAADDQYFNVGLQYQWSKGLKAAAVWKHNERDTGLLSLPGVQQLSTDEIGIWTEVVF